MAYLSRRDPNLVYTPNVTQIQFGKTLQFSCLPGYALHGQEYGECMSDGRISIPGEFFCKGKLGVFFNLYLFSSQKFPYLMIIKIFAYSAFFYYQKFPYFMIRGKLVT